MSTIWTVMGNSGCPPEWEGGLKACVERRGGVFQSLNSSTYVPRDNYSLSDVAVMKNHGLGNEAVHMALDIAALGYPGGDNTKPEKNAIFEFISMDFTLQGLIGLHQPGVNLSNTGGFSYPNPSFIQTMKDANHIPSVSYGYTAGAKYRTSSFISPIAFASLVLTSPRKSTFRCLWKLGIGWLR
jgi:hypothetical protein